MPSQTVQINAIATGPGWLFHAALGSAIPTHTVSGSVFTDAWPGAWDLLGATDEGSEWNYELDTENVEVAELLDPVQVVATGRNISLNFALANISAENFKRAMNGGVITTSGSGATLLSELAPPVLGAEVKCMIGWESQDSTERLIGYQCMQTGSITTGRKKGADKALISCEFKFEKPVSDHPFRIWTAGTARG
jgi:hypothetical protein